MRLGCQMQCVVMAFLLVWSEQYLCQGGYIQVETKDFVHRFVPGLDIGKSAVTFSVRSCQDIRVSLQQTSSSANSNAFEIVIGGDSNARSHINKAFDSSAVLTVSTPSIASCSETRRFWISWSNRGIMVGKGSTIGNDMFMFTPESPWYSVTAISVSSWKGTRGSYSFDNGFGSFINLVTIDDAFYRPVLNYDLTGRQSFVFSLRACSDAWIRLEPRGGVSSSSACEIGMGLETNSKTILRKGGKEVVVWKNALLSCNLVSQLWVSWSDGRFKFGAGGNVGYYTYMDYYDPGWVFPVATVSVYTDWGKIGNWYFD